MRMRVVAIGFFLACSAAAQEQSGTIVFFREPHAMTGEFKPPLFCDGEQVARIENGTSYELQAPPGLHTCTVESLQRPGGIQVNVIGGKTAYVHVRLLKGIRDRAELAITTEDEYEKQKPRLKPVKEWTRAALVKPDGDSGEANPAPLKHPRDKHAGKFGDLALRITRTAMTRSSPDRDTFVVFLAAENTGTRVVCAELGATLNTSFGLQYRGFTGLSGGFPPAPRIREMLPGEIVEGSYKFEIKHGVQPLEVVLKLESARYDGGVRTTTIRCGSDGGPFKDVFIPDEIRLDIRDLPIAGGWSIDEAGKWT
jgi:hypothetical protein